MLYDIQIPIMPDLSTEETLHTIGTPRLPDTETYQIDTETLNVFKDGMILYDSERDVANKVRAVYQYIRSTR